MQSVLKLKDSTRMDVECLLFTDLLLICKPSKRMEKYKIIKPPMRVDRMIIQELKDKGSFLLIYLNEYHVPVSAFTFHADQASIRVWVEHIRKAQTLYREARKSSQGHNSFMYPGNEEVVEEEVIRTTPSTPSTRMFCLPPRHLTTCPISSEAAVVPCPAPSISVPLITFTNLTQNRQSKAIAYSSLRRGRVQRTFKVVITQCNLPTQYPALRTL